MCVIFFFMERFHDLKDANHKVYPLAKFLAHKFAQKRYHEMLIVDKNELTITYLCFIYDYDVIFFLSVNEIDGKIMCTLGG